MLDFQDNKALFVCTCVPLFRDCVHVSGCGRVWCLIRPKQQLSRNTMIHVPENLWLLQCPSGSSPATEARQPDAILCRSQTLSCRRLSLEHNPVASEPANSEALTRPNIVEMIVFCMWKQI